MLFGKAIVFKQIGIIIFLSTGTASLWMTSARYLQLKKHFLNWELVVVHSLFFFSFWVSYIFYLLVPVVVIFTKFDALVLKSYNKLRNQQKNHEEAKSAMHELANKTFQDHYLAQVQATEVPPKTYICLAGNILYLCKAFLKFSQILDMDKEENQCSELSERTMDILDNDVLVQLFVSTQTNNLDLCIKNGIM